MRQGVCSPCGDITIYCKNEQQGSCIKSGYRCGNDSCGHPDSTCGAVATQTPVPTSIPTTNPNPTSSVNPTNGPSPTPGSPTSSPSPTSQPGATNPPNQPTPTPCVTEAPRTNNSGPMNLIIGLFDIVINGTNVTNPCSTGPTPTISTSVTEIPTPSVSVSPTPITDGSLINFRELFSEIETKFGVPSRITEAVLTIESPNLLNLTSDQINLYSQPGNTIPGCGPNVCSATGPMQMTIGTDNKGSTFCSACGSGRTCPNAWSYYGNSVNNYNSPPHSSNVCNLRDNVYGAALKLKSESKATSMPWTKEQVYRAAESYYSKGACSDNFRYKRLGNRTYCEFVWWYYTIGS